jgi:recombinational DNA repair protein RecT
MLANIAQATRSNSALNAFIAAAVLDLEIGESLEYRQLIKLLNTNNSGAPLTPKN